MRLTYVKVVPESRSAETFNSPELNEVEAVALLKVREVHAMLKISTVPVKVSGCISSTVSGPRYLLVSYPPKSIVPVVASAKSQR